MDAGFQITHHFSDLYQITIDVLVQSPNKEHTFPIFIKC